jgi:hypothetical protein
MVIIYRTVTCRSEASRLSEGRCKVYDVYNTQSVPVSRKLSIFWCVAAAGLPRTLVDCVCDLGALFIVLYFVCKLVLEWQSRP